MLYIIWKLSFLGNYFIAKTYYIEKKYDNKPSYNLENVCNYNLYLIHI